MVYEPQGSFDPGVRPSDDLGLSPAQEAVHLFAMAHFFHGD